jgi:hypothetical protein
LEQEIANYPNLEQLFKDQIPKTPVLYQRVYNDLDAEKKAGKELSFWGILSHGLHFKNLLQRLDDLVGRHKSAYGESRLRSGIVKNVFSFLSELEIYDAFVSRGVTPEIEPPPTAGSKRKLDMSVRPAVLKEVARLSVRAIRKVSSLLTWHRMNSPSR